MSEEVAPTAPTESTPTPFRISAASLFCDACGRVTTHRVVRWDRTRSGAGRSGVARCRECQWTHRFAVHPVEEVEVDLITSRGAISSREKLRLPGSVELVVGADLPGSRPPMRVHRIDLRHGGSAPRAAAALAGSVWVSPHLPPSVPVSILEGARTRTTRWSPGPGIEVGVGETVQVDGLRLRVVALRVRGRTYRRAGDRFAARDVDRLYGRRTVSPPAGRADWSQDRETPRSRTRSFSRSPRSRSGPGATSMRRVPRARTAEGGATVHSFSPS